MLSYLKAYAEYERKLRGHSAETVDTYTRTINQFHGWLVETSRDTNPDAVTQQDVEQYLIAIVFRYKNIKNSTRAQKLSALRSFFDFMVYIELLKLNPTKEIPSPKIPKHMPTKFTTHELARIFGTVQSAAADGAVWNIRDHALLKVMYASGMRVSELCELSLEQVNDTGRLIRLEVNGKGAKRRVLTLRANPAAALRAWLPLRLTMATDHTAVFISGRHKEPLKAGGINEVLKKYAELAGMNPTFAHVHKMRATCFADMYDGIMNRCPHCGAAINKEDIYTLAAFAGHEDPKTMKDYVNISDTVQKRGITDRRMTELGKLSDKYTAEGAGDGN